MTNLIKKAEDFIEGKTYYRRSTSAPKKKSVSAPKKSFAVAVVAENLVRGREVVFDDIPKEFCSHPFYFSILWCVVFDVIDGEKFRLIFMTALTFSTIPRKDTVSQSPQ